MSGVVLIAASAVHFSSPLAGKGSLEPAGASVAACSELRERRDRLRAEIARLHAETAVIEAELGAALCKTYADVDLPPLLALPSQSPGGTSDEAGGAAPARRRGKDELMYDVHCWAPSSTFADASCNCLGEAAHPELGSRRKITIVIGSWYGPRPSSLASHSMS